MITHLQAQNFKSWHDTGRLRLAPLTGFFGTNSSGKTSLLQLLLMLKQTAESPDRNRVLHTGDDRSLVDLGTFYDLIHAHSTRSALRLHIDWQLAQPLEVTDPQNPERLLFSTKELQFETIIREQNGLIGTNEFHYRFDQRDFGMRRQAIRKTPSGWSFKDAYELVHQGFEAKRASGRAPNGTWPLPRPVKCYGFPDEATGYYQNTGFLPDFALSFETLFASVYYLGPLHEYPHRSYLWAGERPVGVGRRGEQAIAALLAARAENMTFARPGSQRRRVRVSLDEHIADWMQRMGLIHSFSLKPLAPNRKDYEVRVRRTPAGPDVSLTDVGFGVSQILPVLVLCYYVPEGSTIILEQPEIHLHPAVQADLADVLIEVVKERQVQILVESHSEHLLRRLQRRIAEEMLTADQTALYFCTTTEGESRAQPLKVDDFGNITNWPPGFFGDEIGELAAMTKAAMRRQMGQEPVGTKEHS